MGKGNELVIFFVLLQIGQHQQPQFERVANQLMAESTCVEVKNQFIQKKSFTSANL